MFGEEKCPKCGFEDYEINEYWDDFDEENGIRVWECTCEKCHQKFDIIYTYKCTGITAEVSAS
jgi:hypothetical protein